MFSFLTSFSSYVGKIFARPVPRDELILDYELSKAVLFKAFIFTQNKTLEVEKAIQLLKNADSELSSEALDDYSFPGFGVFEFDVNIYAGCEKAIENLYLYIGRRVDFPLIFVKGNCVGSLSELQKLSDSGVLKKSLEKHDYNLVVVGGGSGGLAAAKKAANIDKDVAIAVLDFVKPTPVGTTWGLGGTCVNVGCIPKKLMHQAAILGKNLEDARKFGWKFDEKTTCDWKALVDNVHNHILALNWNYKSTLREKKVTYLNAYGSFVDSHTLKAVQKNGQETLVTSDKFLIATGLRPRYLDIPGAKEYCITSDDLFTLPYSPGKTLVVGASYVALECAGFLHGCGFDVTVMVRSILLRGFDQDMAQRIGKHMKEIGVKFIEQTIPTLIERIEEGKPNLLKVTSKSETGEIIVGEYNTVLLAIGRDAVTDDLALDKIGVTRNSKNKKIVCYDNEQSVSAPHVYAIGDVLDGKPELTPVAIQAGRFLVSRLFDHKLNQCDYLNVPTTVFTPLEYGCCGYSEEDAREKFGDLLKVYHAAFTPLEFTVAKREDSNHCYAKLMFAVDPTDNDIERVVGLHILGPNAGEITQGFAIAFKTKATKDDFKNLVGIHPTCAEVLTFASLIEKVGDEPVQAAGC